VAAIIGAVGTQEEKAVPAADERLRWARREAVLPLLGVGVLACGVALILGVLLSPWVLVVLAPVLLLILSAALFRVSVDATGLRVAFGILGWPSRRLPLSAMRRAAAVRTSPREWGGWGYRVARDGSAVITRAGEALQVYVADGNRFVVTVGDAEGAARTLNACLRRRQARR
jgi:hypothetical protein